MPSSKKIRGRARKEAKEKERQSGIDEDFSLILRRFQPGRSRGGCMHGFLPYKNLNPSSGDDVTIYNILETVAETICTSEKKNDRVGGAFEAVRRATDSKYPSLYNGIGTIEILSKALLSIGAELILDKRAGTSNLLQIDFKAKNSFRCATILGFTEYLVQYKEVNVQGSKPCFYFHKVHELICSDERRMVSYLIKRIPCSCLNTKFSLLKSEKKMSVCCHLYCDYEKVELKSLMKCEGCRKAHYCSQKCQAADFEVHKLDCVAWKKWRKLKKKISPKPQDEFVDS